MSQRDPQEFSIMPHNVPRPWDFPLPLLASPGLGNILQGSRGPSAWTCQSPLLCSAVQHLSRIQELRPGTLASSGCADGEAQVLPAHGALQHLSAMLGQVPTPPLPGTKQRWETDRTDQVGDRAPFQHPYALTFPPTLFPSSARVFLSGLDSSSILSNVLLILKPQNPNICFLYYLFSTVAWRFSPMRAWVRKGQGIKGTMGEGK